MVDIQELMRTYVFLNDPDVKEVTTKFGALVLGITVVALGAWAGVTYLGGDDASTGGEAYADASDSSETEQTCVDESNTDEWKADNPETLERLIDVQETDGEVCYTYAVEN
jgi:hypothetical protein